MKMKRILGFLLIAAMILAMLGCQSNTTDPSDTSSSSSEETTASTSVQDTTQTSSETSTQTTAQTESSTEITTVESTSALQPLEPSPNAATVLSEEKDAALKASLQESIDKILNTKTEIVHSNEYIPGKTYTGKAYYVSADGNDNNDGLTPKTAWKTAEKVMEEAGGVQENPNPILKEGDAVFFRRGDTFRISVSLALMTDGITYSAYGEGEKPIITASSENGAGVKKWTLVYEDETGKKIWKYYRDMNDVAMVVMNDGEVIATRVYEYYDEGSYISCEIRNWLGDAEGNGVRVLNKLLSPEESMTENHKIISRPERFSLENNYSESGVGPLYMRCDEGNPGELYDSIEFSEYHILGNIWLGASDTVFDNISFRSNGNSYIKNADNTTDQVNTLIQNCEFAYCGGSVTFYSMFPLNVGVQGDGIYGIVSNATIRNNYFHDSLAPTMTYEGDLSATDRFSGYYHVLDNVMVNTFGIRLDSSAERLKYLDSVILKGNQIWNTGELNVGKVAYSEGGLFIPPAHYGEFIIEDNVIYVTEKAHNANALINGFTYMYEFFEMIPPVFQNNTYVQYSGRDFGFFNMHGGEKWSIDDPELLTKVQELMNDTTSEFYVIQ